LSFLNFREIWSGAAVVNQVFIMVLWPASSLRAARPPGGRRWLLRHFFFLIIIIVMFIALYRSQPPGQARHNARVAATAPRARTRSQPNSTYLPDRQTQPAGRQQTSKE
jgi:hypothetical protein